MIKIHSFFFFFVANRKDFLSMIMNTKQQIEFKQYQKPLKCLLCKASTLVLDFNHKIDHDSLLWAHHHYIRKTNTANNTNTQTKQY